ncbi:MAG: hypothetical protein ACLPYS_08930 [Vulcanimicrobiaceae bacterium]
MKKFFVTLAVAGAIAMSVAPGPISAQTVLAKRGWIVDGVLQQTLNSKTNHDGDTFTLTEKDTLFHHNPALKGAIIEGHLENVTPAGPTHKATLSIILDDLKMPDGSTLPIHAKIDSIKEFEPKTHHMRDAALIIGGAVAGHMAAKQHHGGLAGAAAGFALASTMKSDVNVKQGTLVNLKLTQDLVEAAPGTSPT